MPIIDHDTTVLSSAGQFEQVWASGTGALKASLDSLQARLAIPGRYEVIEELGRGGMGIVYRVRDIETCEIVAIKILKPEIAADPAMWESLRKEVCLARKVTHKNVCRIYEFTRSETTACISMEYVCGETLLSKLQRRGALAPVDAVEIAVQICAGLGEAHAQGIVHRDLKPANIVIAHDRTVKIMDFGVARKSHDAITGTEDLAGTPAYMSPEQLQMKPVTFRTDIYSLGMILFEMLTGTQAFAGENAIELAIQQIRQEPPRPSSIVSTIPARLDSVILRCLKKDPAERFASVADLKTALEKAVAPVTAAARPPIEYKYFQAASVALQRVGRAALSDLKLLQQELARGANRIYRTARPKIESWIVALRSSCFVSPSGQRAQAVLFGGAILAASVLFGFVMRAETHAQHATPGNRALAPLAATAPPKLAPTAASVLPPPVSPFTAKEFDFDASPPSPDALPDSETDAEAAADPSPLVIAKPAGPSHVNVRTKKTHLQANALPPTNSEPKTNLPAASAPASTVPVPEVVGMLPLNSQPTSTALLAFQSAGVLKAPAHPVQQPSTPLPDSFLEVGSFNDSGWANDAVNHLSQLGLPARAVRKTHLWMQSYRVEVGPFKTLSALEAAEELLTQKGFKPRAVK